MITRGAGVVLVLVVVSAALVLLRPVRERFLPFALGRLDAALPGTLQVERARWPTLGNLVLEGVHWTGSAADTVLGAAQRLDVDVGLRSLWERDLVLHRVAVQGLRLDLPALRRAFAAGRDTDTEPRGPDRRFPRPGALVGVPSIAIDTLRLEAPALRLANAGIEALQLEAAFEARHARVPRLRVHHAQATGPPDGWRVDSLGLDVDIEHGTATGRGTGRVGPHWPMQLVLATDAPDHLVLHVGETGAPAPPEALGIAAAVAIVRHGLAVDSLVFTARVRTPGTLELARVPALATWLRDRPTAAGVQCAATGTLAFAPTPQLRLVVDFVPGDLVGAGSLALHRDAEAMNLRCDSLHVADVRVRGSLRRGTDSLTTSLQLDVDGPRWQEWLGRKLGPPWTLHGRFDFRRQRAAPTAAVALQGRGTLAGHEIDRIAVSGALGIAAPSALRLGVTSHGVDATIAGEITLGDTLRLQLTPLWLRVAGSEPAPDPGPRHSTLRRVARTGRITGDALQIRGDAGDAELRCDVTPGSGGSLSARLAWPTLPALLARFCAATTADSLRAHWNPDAPYGVEFAAAAGPNLDQVAGAGEFVLPGPRTFAGLTPFLRVEDLGALRGRLDFEVAGAGPDRHLELQLDAAHTTWIDTLQLRVRTSRDGVRVEQATLDLDSLRIEAEGTLGKSGFDLRARYDVDDVALLRRATALDTLVARTRSLALRGTARLHGSRAHPDFAADCTGQFVGHGLRIPEFAARIERDSAGVQARLDLQHGITSPWIALDRVQTRWQSESGAWFPGQLGVDAVGAGFALRQSVQVESRSPWDLTLQAFRLGLADKELAAAAPCRIAIDAARLRVDGLELGGSLGAVRATGVASRDSTHFTAAIALDLPEPPACLVVRRDLWPRRLRVDLDAPHPDSLHAQISVQGFQLAGGGKPELALDLRALPGALHAVTSLADTADIVRGTITLPAHLQLWPPQSTLGDGAVAADLRVARLPFGIHTTRAQGALAARDLGRVQGRVVLGGTARALAAFTDLEVRFPDAPHLAPYTFALRAHAGSDTQVDSLWRSTASTTATSTTDLVLACTLFSESTPLVRGDATLPLHLALARPFVRADSTRALALHLRAEDVPLAACNPLLPRGAALHGETTIVLDVVGPLQDPHLDGRLTTSAVELVLGDGSRVEFVAQATLGGGRRRPVLRGDIEVKTALVKVPEAQKNLHPTAGESLLRPASADTLAAASERPTAAAPAPETDAPPAALARSDIDIRIRVPRAFWVRGRGLDIEGRGDLQIAQQEGRPTVAGALHGVRGTFAIAGRTLILDRATVDFQGGTDVNPKLSVQLSTAIAGTKIRVLVNGTAAAPELTLSSDPEMEQSDIIALLALGKTYDQLSDEESGIMRERATAILVSMGAAALQENVTQELGIDVVQYRSNSGAPGAKSADEASTGSLAFGKYLSPKVLLSYSYSLDRAVEDIVSLEYFLKGQLTLETLYSIKGQSGLGFGWTKEY